MDKMYYNHIHSLTPLGFTSTLHPSPNFMSSFFYNSWSLVYAFHILIGVGPFIGTLLSYQVPHYLTK